MIPDNLIRIGILSRPHGIDGTMILRISGNFEDELIKKEFLFLSFDGTMVPFSIKGLRLTGDIAYLSFLEITSQGQTELLKGKEAFISVKSSVDSGDFTTFITFTIRDETSGRKGEIVNFYDNPENPLFLMLSEGEEFLVPANPDLIISSDNKNKILFMKLPDGIFKLGE